MQEDPIPSLDHFPGHLRIAGFIRIPEIPLPQINKKEQKAECQEKTHLTLSCGHDLSDTFSINSDPLSSS